MSLKTSQLVCLYAVLLLLLGTGIRAATLTSDPTDRLSTVPHEPAMEQAVKDSGLDLVAIRHEGWTETLPSFARLVIYDITGRTRIKGQNPVYTLLGMTYNPGPWQDARILPIEHPDLLKDLSVDGKWVSAHMVKGSPGLKALIDRLEETHREQAEYQSARRTLGAMEQINRLGASDRVIAQQIELGVSADTIRRLRANPEELRQLHQRRAELERKLDAGRAYTGAAERLLHRVTALDALPSQMLLVPDAESIDGAWVRPATAFVTPTRITTAGREFELAIQRAFLASDASAIVPATAQFLDAARESRYYPTEPYRQAMNVYVLRNPWRLAAWTYLAASMAFGLFFFFRNRWWCWAGIGLMMIGFAFNTAAVGLRLYIRAAAAGQLHMPVSNMFEALTFMGWCIMVIAVVLELAKRTGFIGAGSSVVAFLYLLGASMMPMSQTALAPLRAVLNSYWLNIHVTLMLLSYAAFAIAAFFALVYLVRSMSGRELRRFALMGGGGGLAMLAGYAGLAALQPVLMTSSRWLNLTARSLEVLLLLTGGVLVCGVLLMLLGFGIRWIYERFASQPAPGDVAPLMPLPQNEEFAYRLVQFAWPVLTLGIALGAVWADTAWGRFWGWDPKETWAFITWVTYTVYLHMRMVMGWRGRWSAAACLLGFGMVMITMLGVSYLPWFSGGLHSYASPT